MLFALQPLIINYKVNVILHYIVNVILSSCMCGAYRTDTLQIVPCQWVVGYILTGTYVEEGIVMFLESVIRPRQQFKQYDMEVSLHEAPCIIIAKYDQLFIRIIHTSTGHISKQIYLMSLRHLDTPTWDERSIIVWSIWLHLSLPDIPQYRKSLTICHKLEAATHGHHGTESGNHRHLVISV